MYTVSNDNGPMARGLSALEAAQMILGDDGHLYELRQRINGAALGPYFTLYISERSINGSSGAGRMVACRVPGAYAATEAGAWEAIAPEVIHASHNWRGPRADLDVDIAQWAAEAATA